MDIQENFGWMHICRMDTSKSYIIGGSEEANEALRNKYLGDDYKLPDSGKSYYQQSRYISKMELTSENYNDILKIKGMPLSCLSGDYGEQVTEKIDSMLRSYYSGELSVEEVQQKIKNICTDMRVAMVQERYTNGYNVKDNQQMLEQIYGCLQKRNVGQAYAANDREGVKIAAEYGGVEDYNWMYYNSDYYYKAEKLRNIFRQTIREMIEEWETDNIDFEKVEENSLYALAGGMEYNTVWQHHALQRSVICMTDVDAVPPKNLTFFYQEKKVPGWDANNKLEYQKGYVEITYHNKKWSADVPYDIYGEKRIDFYHMQDFMDQYLLGDMEEECSGFLSKFDIFKEVWASMKDDSSIWKF